MTNDLRGKVAIAGVGETDYSRNSGRSELTLALQAIHAALDDAGLTAKDVDGLMQVGEPDVLGQLVGYAGFGAFVNVNAAAFSKFTPPPPPAP